MFNGAMFWTGRHLCEVMNSLGLSDTQISACEGNEQTVGSIAVMWAAMVLVFWRLFPRK